MRFARRHWVFLGVLAAAIGLRAAVLRAYTYPFWFPDSGQYVDRSTTWQPDQYRPPGYAAFLGPFVPGPLIWVAVVQHLIGVGLVVAGYLFLTRRGVRPWLAALAVTPVAADDLQLTMEHFISSDMLFTGLLGTALLVLAWCQRVSVVVATAGGLFLAAAVLTRTVGQPVIVLVLGYLLVKLLVKQAGWRSLVAFTLAVAAPLAGYVLWFHHFYGVYAFDQMSGRALYSRVMSISDCDRLKLTDRQRLLCVSQPPSERPEAPDYWGWSAESPAGKYFPSLNEDPFLRAFGVTVIKQQPGDYLFLVAKETSWHFLPRAPLSAETLCRFGGWRLPERPNTLCNATFYDQHPVPANSPENVPQPSTPLRSALAEYSHVAAAARGPMLGFALLVALGAMVWRPRRGSRRHTADALLFAGAGFGLLLGSVAFGMYEPRYAVTSVFLIPLAAALALRRHHREPTPQDKPIPDRLPAADGDHERPAEIVDDLPGR